MFKKRLLGALLTCVFLSCCGKQQREAKLQERLKSVSDRLDDLSQRVHALESQDAVVYTEQEQHYGLARTQFGAFTVSCKGVTPYLDGFKIRLEIGNPTSATFLGAKLHVRWRRLPREPEKVRDEEMEKQFRAMDEALSGLHLEESPEGFSTESRYFDLTTVLYPGSYAQANISLTPASPEAVKFIWVGIELDEMYLSTR